MLAKQLPPHIARELRRHVAATSSKASTSNSNGGSNTRVLLACVGFVGLVSAVPYVCVRWIGHLTSKDDTLSSSQIRRGAFNNSGSRDAGRDPNWEKGVYKRSKELEELLEREDPNQIELEEHHLRRAQGRR